MDLCRSTLLFGLCFASSLASSVPLKAQSLPTSEMAEKTGPIVPADDDNGTLSETMRLETVSYHLSTANPDACPKQVMRTGLVIHDLARYAPDQRARIARDYGMTYGFGVLGVVPGSTGDLAGVRKGDEIIAVNGRDLADYQKASLGAKPTYARTGAFTDFLAETLADGPATLLIRRGTDRLTLSLSGLPGCGGYVTTVKSGTFNAWSDGRRIAATTQLIHYAMNDSELAFVVAHEMAHNLLGHNTNTDRLASLIAIFGPGSAHIRRNEIDADKFAVHLLAHTPYETSAAVTLLARLNRNVFLRFAVDFTHPSLAHRIALAKAAIASEDAAAAALAMTEFPTADQMDNAWPKPYWLRTSVMFADTGLW